MKEITKDFTLRARMYEETLNRLEGMCAKTGMSRFELARKFIVSNSAPAPTDDEEG